MCTNAAPDLQPLAWSVGRPFFAVCRDAAGAQRNSYSSKQKAGSAQPYPQSDQHADCFPFLRLNGTIPDWLGRQFYLTSLTVEKNSLYVGRVT